jgi:chromosome segregation ATPase
MPDDSLDPLGHSAEEWNDELSQALGEYRNRATQFVASQRQRLHEAEQRLMGHVTQVADQLARLQELDRRQAEIDAADQRLRRLQEELQQQRQLQEAAAQHAQSQTAQSLHDIQARQDELAARESALQAAHERLHQEQAELQKLREQLAHDSAQLGRLRQCLEARAAELDAQRDRLTSRWDQLKEQRRRIAEHFRQQRAEQNRQIEVLRKASAGAGSAENSAPLQRALDEALARSDRLSEQLTQAAHEAQLRGEELQAARAETSRLQQQVAGLHKELEALRKASQAAPPSRDASAPAQAEKEVLIQRLVKQAEKIAAVEQELARAHQELAKLKDQQSNGGGSDHRLEDMHRRYEMAIEDLKAERARRLELEAQLARAKASASSSSSEGTLDWESQKRRLLASLEADFDDDEASEERKQQRLAIEDVIRKTDEIVAAKNREVESLEQLLKEQSSNVGALGVGVNAVAEVLDKDEVIRQERENLLQLQNEWREKLRQAEIDISLDRAKIARERAELEQKLSEIRQAAAASASGGKPSSDKADKKPSVRRWLSRLGLKDEDD